jgi:type I restriction enzyme S subunit
MELSPGYKQTEVGVIPKDWDVKPFETIAHIERGKFTARPRNDPKYYGGAIPFIQTGDVTNSIGQITAYSQTLNREGLKVSKLFSRGTLFFTIAANIGDVGFAAFDTACPDSLVAITPNKGIDKHWLAHELRGRKASFENLATNNTQLNINLERLRPYMLPVPPPAEQEAIAEALSDADALIESVQQRIAKTCQIKQGTMQELLRPKQGWVTENLGKLFHLSAGRPKNKALSRTGRFVVMDMGAVSTDGKVLDSKRTDLEEDALCIGDLVMPKDDIGGGHIIGKVAFIVSENKFVLGDHVYRLQKIGSLVEPLFFYYLINSEYVSLKLRTKVAGSAQLGLGRTSVLEQPTTFPRDPVEQTAIASILSDIDAEITKLEEELMKLCMVKQGMMQELLTGKVRLL